MNFCFHRSVTDQAVSSGQESVVWDTPLDPGLASDVDSTNHKVTIEDKELLTSEPTLKLPAQLAELHVRVSHVNSPSSFYVQLAQDHSRLSRSADRTDRSFLNTLNSAEFSESYCSFRVCELLKERALVETPDGREWRADMYCSAEINGVWERGRICSDVTASNIAEVGRPLQ